MRQKSLDITPKAILSRAVAGIRGKNNDCQPSRKSRRSGGEPELFASRPPGKGCVIILITRLPIFYWY
jgi:hypothetical protein